MNKLIELIESFHLFATKYLLQKVVEFVEFVDFVDFVNFADCLFRLCHSLSFFLQTLIDKTINR